jgi:hypothetical protein
MGEEEDVAAEKRMWGGVSRVSRSAPRELLSPPSLSNREQELTPPLTSRQGGTATMSEDESVDSEKRMWGGVSPVL